MSNLERLKKERRFKIMYVDKNLIVGMLPLNNKHRLEYTSGLPAQYVVDDVYYDWPSERFGFRVYSEEYPTVQEGCHADSIWVNFRWVENSDAPQVR